MEITKEQRERQYQLASRAAQLVYDSEESGVYLFRVFQQHRLPDELYRTYALTVGNVILGFYPETQMPQLLVSALALTPEKAQAIATDLHPLLTQIHQPAESVKIPNPSQKIVGYANQPQPEEKEPEQTERPLVPPYRRPFTDEQRSESPRQGGEATGRNPHEGA